ncbi:hypothetical protein EGW08_023301 [Elysia chlorotica]|uniref:Reverse transcriptase/retrotransposon-derived protein RNase H-like domain-containing protein n=1 Tax=Elysia chlorotica TaxID=188477 RepID=A0A433SIT9_ELYCH|nr:hypothetical protein EGW08_023301 [Elysia chlorotica]
MGHVISSDGIKTDPEKVRAIRDFPPPTCLTEVRRLLGMAQYLSRYIRHLTDDLHPIHNLTKKNVPFLWSESQEKAFLAIKSKIVDSPCLVIYDPHKELTLENDASEYGLCSVLLQDGKLIALRHELFLKLRETTLRLKMNAVHTCSNISYSPFKDSRFSGIKAATVLDPVLSQLKLIILQGWPNLKSDLPSCVLPYFNYRDELTVQDGIILRGDRIVIPSSLRQDLLPTPCTRSYLLARHVQRYPCSRRIV